MSKKTVFSNVVGGGEDVVKKLKNTSHYKEIDKESIRKGMEWRDAGGYGGQDAGFTMRVGDMLGRGHAGLQNAALEEGRSVLGMAGSHAVRGAAWGAVGGGTIEATQGGSFWDGAKQGAINGAVGWTGYRMGMKAVGAKSMNPFAKQTSKHDKGGLLSALNNTWKTTSGNADVSGQYIAIMNNRQKSALARSIMNGNKKGS